MTRTGFILILLIIFQTRHFSAQTIENLDRKSIFITAKVTPGLTGDQFGSYAHEVIFEKSYKFVVNGGLEAIFEISKRKWFLETGLLITELGYKEKQSSAFYPNYNIHYIVEKYLYVSAPLSVIRRFKNIYVGGGLNFSYFIIRNRIVDGNLFEYRNSPYQGYSKNEPLDNWLFGINAKAGYMFHINKKWTLRSEFSANATGLLSSFLAPLILRTSEGGFYNFGLGLSVDYKLR